MLLDPHLIKVALNGPLPVGNVNETLVLAGWISLNVIVRAVLTRWELRLSTWKLTVFSPASFAAGCKTRFCQLSRQIGVPFSDGNIRSVGCGSPCVLCHAMSSASRDFGSVT